MQPHSAAFALLFTLALAACSTSTSLSSRDMRVDESYTGGPVGRILVLALVEDDAHDSRVIIERGFTHAMRDAGIDVLAGYTRFDSVDQLLAEPSGFEPRLQELGVDAVLLLDPLRLDTDYDPTAYDDRRTIYRELGWDISESVAFWSKVAHESSASKVVMNAGLWQPRSDRDLWSATYDIKAPFNYDVDMARAHTAEFAKQVINDLRANGLVE